MAADNNLTTFALRNILQMQQGWDASFDGNLIVYVDRGENAIPANPVLLNIKSSALSDTTKIISPVVKTYPKVNSCSPDHLRQVIWDAIQLYPAHSYGLVLWSHGTSWFPEGMMTRSFGRDNGAEMSIAALRDALPIKLDFLIFDACFMGSIEVSYELRNKTDYIMASAAEIISYGFPYKEILPYLFSEHCDLQRVGDEFVDFYNDQSGSLATATISIVDTSKLGPLCDITRQIFPSAKPVEQLDLSEFQQFEVDPQDRMFDMSQVLLSINTNANIEAQYLGGMKEAVIYKNSTANIWEQPLNNFSGLTMFMPTVSNADLMNYYETLSWYKDSGYNTWIYN